MSRIFDPWVGPKFRSPTDFPGRLLVVGESQYLKENDRANARAFRPLPQLIPDVIQERLLKGWPTTFYAKLFFLLTGKRNTEVSNSEWRDTWESLAFQNYAQTKRLTAPKQKLTKAELERSRSAFQQTVRELRPQFILLLGNTVTVELLKSFLIIQRPSIAGVWVQIDEREHAFARLVRHPAAYYYNAAEQRRIVREFLDPARLTIPPNHVRS